MRRQRYQIFVSSTFLDLKEEREAVLRTILKLDRFPAGMELFPAVNDTAWELIKKVIKESDYYVLIIGGKYGSLDESGISYTEKEYDFAVENNIPVVAFIHSDPESISLGKSEIDPNIREKLEAFKQKVKTHHHCNFWQTTEELKENLLTSLNAEMKTNPQIGWIRANEVNKSEPMVDDQDFPLEGKFFEIKYDFFDHDASHKIAWKDLFLLLGKSLVSKKSEDSIRDIILSPILAPHIPVYVDEEPGDDWDDDDPPEPPKHFEPSPQEEYKNIENNTSLHDSTFISIRDKLLAHALIEIDEIIVNGTTKPAWRLTEKGRKIYLSQSVIEAETDGNNA
jgi:hypothetical protein